MYHLSCFLTGNSFSIYVNAAMGWHNLFNNNFCEIRMTGSIVALFVECKVYERACNRLIESVIKIMFFPVISLKAIHIFLCAWILNSNFTLTPNLTLIL